MRFRSLIRCMLLTLIASTPLLGQEQPNDAGPVTKHEVRSLFIAAQDYPETLEQTNHELLAAVRARGVDFVLLKEEEWSLSLMEASEELLGAIRDALSPEDRQARLKAAQRNRLYADFMNNYRSTDPGSRATAIQAGKEFVRLYQADQKERDAVATMNRMIPVLERMIRMPPPRVRPIVRRGN